MTEPDRNGFREVRDWTLKNVRGEDQLLELPATSRVIHAEADQNQVILWVESPKGVPLWQRWFRLFHNVSDLPRQATHIQTLLYEMDGLQMVTHLYEVYPKRETKPTTETSETLDEDLNGPPQPQGRLLPTRTQFGDHNGVCT